MEVLNKWLVRGSSSNHELGLIHLWLQENGGHALGSAFFFFKLFKMVINSIDACYKQFTFFFFLIVYFFVVKVANPQGLVHTLSM